MIPAGAVDRSVVAANPTMATAVGSLPVVDPATNCVPPRSVALRPVTVMFWPPVMTLVA